MIRELIGGKIMLMAEADGSLWGDYNPNPAALFQPQGRRGRGAVSQVGSLRRHWSLINWYVEQHTG
jgi:hypothetical protein